jgi:hypothetical protein
LSGHQSEEFAREDELRREFSTHRDLRFIDTTAILAQDWPGLFQSGHFQFQVLDPQSIEGGIPFRLFECGAAAAPLLSDSRVEFASMTQNNKESFLVKNEEELGQMASQLRKTEPAELERVGKSAFRRFLPDHTWQKRWTQITNPSVSIIEVGMAKMIEEAVRQKSLIEARSIPQKRRSSARAKVVPSIPTCPRTNSSVGSGQA